MDYINNMLILNYFGLTPININYLGLKSNKSTILQGKQCQVI